jgi:hypothetical protein
MSMTGQSRPSVTQGRARTTSVAWLAHVQLTFDEWQGYGSRIGLVSKSTNWWLGDWVRFGQRHYDQRYQQASEVTGYDEQTLMNFAYVSGRYEISRRRENLSWSHHAELAPLQAFDQDVWLERAVAERLSVRQLRAQLRRLQQPRTKQLTSPLPADAGDLLVMDAPPHLLVCPHCDGVLTLAEGLAAARYRQGGNGAR